MRWRKKRKNGKFFIFYYLVWRSSFIIRNGQQAEDGRQGRKSSRTVENVVYPWFKSLNQITDTQPYLLIKRNLTRGKCEFNFSAPLAQQQQQRQQLLATSLRFSSYRCCHLNGAILMDCDRWSSAAATAKRVGKQFSCSEVSLSLLLFRFSLLSSSSSFFFGALIRWKLAITIC